MNHSQTAGRLALPLLFCALAIPSMAASRNTITIMSRNMDAGTDFNYILGAVDESSFIQGVAATLDEIKASGIPQRADRLAEEIAATTPDLIGLQEVTLWRTGPLGAAATDILYDQLDLLLAALAKRNLHYGIVAIQAVVDTEAPVPTAGLTLRLTDRDVILARLDLRQSEFDLTNAQTHRFRAAFVLGNPVLGQLTLPCGWLSVDITLRGARFRFVNTHLESPVPGVPEAAEVQVAQAQELIASVADADVPVIIVGDLNANAEPGIDHFDTTKKLVEAGFADAWPVVHPGEAGYTWPLFGEDQDTGPATPSKRIDLIYTRGTKPHFFTTGLEVLSAERTGMQAPASDHAGLVVKLVLE